MTQRATLLHPRAKNCAEGSASAVHILPPRIGAAPTELPPPDGAEKPPKQQIDHKYPADQRKRKGDDLSHSGFPPTIVASHLIMRLDAQRIDILARVKRLMAR